MERDVKRWVNNPKSRQLHTIQNALDFANVQNPIQFIFDLDTLVYERAVLRKYAGVDKDRNVDYNNLCDEPNQYLGDAHDIVTVYQLLSKEEDWPEDFVTENGNYMNECRVCGRWFDGYKRRIICKICHQQWENNSNFI